jgi:integrase/recombinase XerC
MAIALDGLSPASARGCRNDLADLARFLRVSSAEAALRELVGIGYGEGNRQVEGYRNAMMARGLADRTVQHRISTIRAAMRRARRAGKTAQCIDVIHPGTAPSGKASPLTPEGWVKLLTAAEAAYRNRPGPDTALSLAVILLLHDEALHRREVVALDYDDFDPTRPALRVPKRVTARGGTVALIWKPIAQRTREAVSAWVGFRGASAGPLFRSLRPGARPFDRMPAPGVNRVVRELGKRAGLGAGVRPLDLRSVAIAEAIDEGLDLWQVRASCRLGSVGHVATLDRSRRWFEPDEPLPLFRRPVGTAPGPPQRKPLPVILGGRHEPPVVRGQPMPVFKTVVQYDVVKTLVSVWPAGLTGAELIKKSGHGGAVTVFHALRKSDPVWAAELVPPGHRGAGERYRLRSANPGACGVQLLLFDDKIDTL